MSLTADDLAGMRTTVNASFPDSAQIQRNTTGSDGAGGRTASWNAVATVACRFGQPSGDERIDADRLAAHGEFVLHVPDGTDIRATDRVVISSVTYEVIEVEDHSWQIEQTCRIVRLA